MKPIICIAGPTASGKSALAVRLAKAVGGEVINADSMQVYSDIQVLSARPTPEEMGGVPHHLFGHVTGDVHYSTGAWIRDVTPIVIDCLAKDEVPILTGGTGLYFKALFDGIADIPDVSSRAMQESADTLDRMGIEKFRAKCEAIDLPATAKVLGHDPQRLLRIYSVWLETGRSLSEWQVQTIPVIPKDVARFAVVMPDRSELYNRINARFDQMVELGGVDEAKRVLDSYDRKNRLGPMFKAIGLSHLMRFHQGELSYEAAIDLAKRDSRRLAKRQMTWFRNQTPDWTKLSSEADMNMFIHSVPNHVT